MKRVSHSIKRINKILCSVLMLVTPERSVIKRAQKIASPLFSPTPPDTMKLEMRSIEGIHMRYAEAGDRQHPKVVLLSPLPQSILCYRPIWKQLTQFCHVFAYDMPGFGHSSGDETWMTFKKQGEFLAKVLETFDLVDAHIIGPDIGMPAALYYAINDGKRARSLMVGDGPGVKPSNAGSIINKMVRSQFWRLVVSLSGAGTFVEVGNRMGYVHYQPSDQEISDYISAYDGRVNTITKWFENYPSGLETIDPFLGQIKIPVKIFWGELDQLLFVKSARHLAEKIPSASLHIIPDCGHFSYQDAYPEFLKMVLDWVQGKGDVNAES